MVYKHNREGKKQTETIAKKMNEYDTDNNMYSLTASLFLRQSFL